jgi:predicted TPR repeat methyltransferase
VHFEAMDTITYIMEIHRVLMPGGRALLHYSVNEVNPEGSYASDPSWRNFFSESLMRHIASRAGFGVLERRVFEWPVGSDNPKTDGLILLEKP